MTAMDVLDDWLLSDLAVDFRVNDAAEIVCGIGNETATGRNVDEAVFALHYKRRAGTPTGETPELRKPQRNAS